MTHYYYYITAGNILDESSHIYQVAIGQSKAELSRYLFLVANAADNGHYFEIFSTKSAQFIQHIRRTPQYANVPFTSVKAVDLVRFLKNEERLRESATALKTANQQRQALNLACRVQSRINARRG